MRQASCFLVSCALVLILVRCGSPERTDPRGPRSGVWRLLLHLGEKDLPVLFELHRSSDGDLRLDVLNGDERIAVDDVLWRGDSLRIRMPLYDSEFIGVLRGDSVLTGNWHNYLKGPEYAIPFSAQAGIPHRFTAIAPASTRRTDGTWQVHFSPGTAHVYPALGVFDRDEQGRVTGTFLTETGDYRYLEGVQSGDSLLLSGFDGSFAFLFAAELRNDTLFGRFWSGSHWEEPWVAVRDPYFRLRDPDSLTFLREGHSMAHFAFPDLDGEVVSSSDERFQGRVLLVQVMGSWCPNCVDETRLLNELYAKYHDEGLEVLAIGFEKYEEPERATKALRKYRDALHVQYPVLYAGKAGKEAAAEKLPFLNHVMSFPTCVMIDRSGVVRRIRTGIYGPGTGEHYTTYKRSLDLFIRRLLDEHAGSRS
jgi:thiol-disulfide isomerase/thioredoxin